MKFIYRWQFNNYVLILINIVTKCYHSKGLTDSSRFRLRSSSLFLFLLFWLVCITFCNVAACHFQDIAVVFVACDGIKQIHRAPVGSETWQVLRGCLKWQQRYGTVGEERVEERELESHKHTVKVLSPSCVKVLPQVQTFATMRRLWMARCEAGRERGRRQACRPNGK